MRVDQRAQILEAIKKQCPTPTTIQYRYVLSYTIIRFQRFSIQILWVFLFQYLAIVQSLFSFPSLPFYPPIGIAFFLFYLLGNNAFLGILLASIFAYPLKEFPVFSSAYILADIGVAYLSARLCQKTLSSDIRPFSNGREVLKFLKINMFISCPLSSILRMLAFFEDAKFFESKANPISFVLQDIFLYYIDFAMSDLSSILIFSSFLLSWVYVFYSREKISPFPIPAFIFTNVLLYVLFEKIDISILFLVAIILSVLWSYIFGYIIATALMFLLSIASLGYFIAQKQYYTVNVSLPIQTATYLFLVLYVLIILRVGHIKRQLDS
jgi:hypothetical protein